MKKFAVLLLVAMGCGSADNGSGGNVSTGGTSGSGRGGSSGGSGPSTSDGGKGGGSAASGGSNGSGTGGLSTGAGGSDSTGSGGMSTGSGGSDSTGNGGAMAGNSGSGGSPGTGGMSNPGTGGKMAGTGGTMGGTPDAGGGGDIPPLMGTAYVYAGTYEGGSTMTIFTMDLKTGALTKKGNSTAGGGSADYLAIHPSGKFLIASNETHSGGTVTSMSIGADGTLTKLNDAAAGGNGPAAMTVSKDGKWAFSAGYDDGKVGAVPIGEDGKLGTPAPSVQAGAEAHYIVDDGVTGKFVFACSKGAGHVSQYKFDQATGKLTPNSPASVSVSSARHMAFNPNGKWAYVTSKPA